MADEDESFPPEIQKAPSEFIFKELTHLKAIKSSEQPPYPTIRSNLLAAANVYGYLFVGVPDGVKVYSSAKVLEAGKGEKDEIDEVITTISLRNQPNWLAVNSDNLTLAVCCGPQILFFDVRNIANKSKVAKTPFCTFLLSKTATATVTSLHWNPSKEWPHLLAVCLSTGSFHMLSVESTATEIGIRPDNFGASTVCWSPKGKQLVIGKNDGTLHQLTPKLEVRRSVSVATVIDRPVRTCDILWLSTYQFAAAYIAADTEDDNFSQPNLFLAHLPSKNEKRDVIWRNYEDPCFGMNETQSPRYLMAFIDQWEMFIALSSNSTDSTVIAKNKESQVWEIWTLDDSGRAQIPISEFTEEDSAPVGVALITTATERIVVDDTRESEPMPVLVILTNDGILCPFHVINFMGNYPSIVNDIQTLDLAGERIVSGNRGLIIGDGDSKPPGSTKQKLTAKPSVLATSTPKPAASLFEPKADTTLLPDPATQPSFAASTPFAKLPAQPFVGLDGPSIIQSTPAPQIKPPLTREVPLKTTPFNRVKQQGLDESTDTVFGSNKTGSSESVFAPTDHQESPSKPPPYSIGQSSQTAPLTAFKKTPLAPTKSIFPSTIPNMPAQGLPPSGNAPALSNVPQPQGGPPPDYGFSKPGYGMAPSLVKSKEDIAAPATQATMVSVTRLGKAGPAETGTFAKRDMTGFKQPLTRKDSEGSSAPSFEPLRRKSSKGSVDSRASPSVESSASLNAETMNEITSFEQELNDFLNSGPELDYISETLGSNEEKVEMKKEVESLCKFSGEISKTTKELHSEIRDTSTVLLESLSAVEDSTRKQKMGKDATYRAMMYGRPLDPANQKKMKELRGLFEYIQGCVREANAALDLQWERMRERRKMIPGGRKKGLQMGQWESAYQALVTNMKILHEQELKVTLLGQELDRLQLYDTASQTSRKPLLPSSAESSSKGTDLQLLADAMLLKRDRSPAVGSEGKPSDSEKLKDRKKSSGSPAGRKLSPKKQAQLGQMLANRKVTPVRSSGGPGSPSFVTKPVIRSRESQGSPLVTEPTSSPIPDTDFKSHFTDREARPLPEEEMPRFPTQRQPPFKPGRESPLEVIDISRVEPSTQEVEPSPSPTTTSGSTTPSSDLEKSEHEMVKEAQLSPPRVEPHMDPKLQFGTPLSNNLKPQKLSFATPSQGGDVASPFSSFGRQPSAPSTTPPIIPQGSATLAYGAPKTVTGSMKNRDLPSIAMTQQTEAASNLNNPPKVVNIQHLQTSEPPEQPLPDKFEPKPEVPAGAAEVVQKVLNTVKVEKQQQQKEWQEPPGRTEGGNKDENTAGMTSQPPKATFGLQSNTAPAFGGTAMFGSAPKFGSSMGDGAPQFGASMENKPVFGSGVGSVTPSFGFAAQLKPSAAPAPKDPKPPVTSEPLTSAPEQKPSTQSQPPASQPSIASVAPSSSAKPSVFGNVLQKSASFAGFTQRAPDIFATATVKATPKTTSSTNLFSLSTTTKPTATTSDQQTTSVASGPPVPASSGATTTTFGQTSTGVFGTASSVFGTPKTTGALFRLSGTSVTSSSGTGAVFGATTSTATDPSKSSPVIQSSEVASTSATVSVPPGSSVFGSISTSAPSSSIFGVATSSVPSSGLFGSSTSTTSSPASVFGNIATSAPPGSGGGVFGALTTSAPSTGGLFGANATTGAPSGGVFGSLTTSAPASGLFGSVASTASVPSGGGLFGTTASPAPSGGGPFGTSTTSASSGGGLFGTSTTSAPSGGGLFGTSTTSAPSGGGLFGTSTTSEAPSVFGSISTAPSGGFGSPATSTGSVFGSQTQSTGFGFGSTTSSAFGTPAPQAAFGTANTSVFGQKPAFGQSPFSATTQPSSGFGGGSFLGGLGGKPSEEAANKNPFAISGDDQQNTTSLFGNAGSKTFGSSSFGQSPQQKTTAFGEGAGVGSQGFGGFSKPQQTGAFGAAPAFGSSAAFGSPPSFGSVPGRTFGGGFGAQAAPSGGSVFGQAPSEGSGFASFAQTETPGFGNLAQQSGGFGGFGGQQQQQQQQQQQSGFGGGFSNPAKSPSFSGWR